MAATDAQSPPDGRRGAGASGRVTGTKGAPVPEDGV